jgi:hypothetical protein
VITVFEEHPKAYMQRAKSFGFDLEQMERDGTLKIIYLRPLDLSPDETLHEIRAAVAQIGARRVVIDSLSGFELAVASTFRTDFRESMYRLVGTLTGSGITVLMTMEITESSNDLRFSPYVISFLADDLILLRYVEIAGDINKNSNYTNGEQNRGANATYIDLNRVLPNGQPNAHYLQAYGDGNFFRGFRHYDYYNVRAALAWKKDTRFGNFAVNTMVGENKNHYTLSYQWLSMAQGTADLIRALRAVRDEVEPRA